MTEYENRPMAFVAMKFEDDYWRDKRYLIIRNELEKCGYQVCRADEINTSSAVVDEVCRLLEDSNLVVIDSSGDSHSVSYELGYCHGCKRPLDRTLLIRNNSNIPFNYRHFRHRVYKDKRHLRRLIRDYLDISEPLTDDQYGYAFTFEFSEDAVFGYILEGASCIFRALIEAKVSGRCECFSAEQFSIPGRFFTVGIGLRLLRGNTNTPKYENWEKIVERVNELTKYFKGRIKLNTLMSELAEKRAMKAHFVDCGVAEFRDGKIVNSIESAEGVDFFARFREEHANLFVHKINSDKKNFSKRKQNHKPLI